MKMQYVVVILAVVAATMGVVWWVTNRGDPMPAAVHPPGASAIHTPASSLEGLQAPPLPRATFPRAEGAPDAGEPPDVVEIPAWERQIDGILASNTNESQTARVLINSLPGMPPDGQAEAAQHIANLLDDKDYNSVLPVLLNPVAPEEVHSTLFADLMNRGDDVKLRTFLEIVKVPAHPLREEAMTTLGVYVDGDHGTDFARWTAAIDKYLLERTGEPIVEP